MPDLTYQSADSFPVYAETFGDMCATDAGSYKPGDGIGFAILIFAEIRIFYNYPLEI